MNKRNFHEDGSLRVPNERHAGIVIRGSKVLLVHRIKDGYEYWVFPGGHRRQDEKPEEVVIREIKEETAIIATKPKLVIKVRDDYYEGSEDFYYLCEWISGEEPSLNGEERIKNEEDDFYEPMWVEIKKVKDLNILPKFAKDWLLKNL